MSTCCTTLTGHVFHVFTLVSEQVARPVTPAVWFGLYKHYDLVSLFSPRGTSLDYCFRRHYLFVFFSPQGS